MFRCMMSNPAKTVLSSVVSGANNNNNTQCRFTSTNNNNNNKFISPTKTRTLFSKKMSEMYEKEVPQYTKLINMVKEVNHNTILKTKLYESSQLNRITQERHGAIRIGKEQELYLIGRLFAVMGMYPVAYYDLSLAGIPVHSTAFRPINKEDLEENPFRVFTSLLRIDLIKDEETRNTAVEILSKRDIFSPKVKELIKKFESEGGLTEEEAEEYVDSALETFRWHKQATISIETYNKLKQAHPLVADVVGFKGPHINHLTPRTLDIDIVQDNMTRDNMNPKSIVEGPPRRECPILLRQTSFNALQEEVMYYCNDNNNNNNREMVKGTHTARFGEIEQRGVALTPAGREMYDNMLNEARRINNNNNNIIKYEESLKEAFKYFPDTWEELRKKKLAFFEYRLNENLSQEEISKLNIKGRNIDNIDDLIENGTIKYYPITYEDFLPVSAAGIFTSNLGGDNNNNDNNNNNKGDSQKEKFEEILGRKVLCEIEMYKKIQEDSLSFLK
eukprot:Tbor_TRINITY_DN5100_c2_g1::TRINITY_DN5100_c2_g1_i5::g.26089::m.26089